MAKTKRAASFFAVYLLLFAGALGVRTAEVYDSVSPFLPQWRSYFMPLLLLFLSLCSLWSIYRSRRFFKGTGFSLWNRPAYTAGVFSFIAAGGMALWLVFGLFPDALAQSQPYEIFLAVGGFLCALLLVIFGIGHLRGGWGRRRGIHYLLTLLPLVFFTARLIYIFITLVAIYPTVQHILDQLKDTVLVLFFLGYAKVIWFSKDSGGNKLVIYMSFIGALFIGVAVLPQMILSFLGVIAPMAMEAVSQDIFYAAMILYMLVLGGRAFSLKR